jgi:hypothetical protein
MQRRRSDSSQTGRTSGNNRLPRPAERGAPAGEKIPLPDALALLTPEGWTKAHRKMLKRDVFGPVDARRRAFGRRKLSPAERDHFSCR